MKPDHKAALEIAQEVITMPFYEDVDNLAACYLDLTNRHAKLLELAEACEIAMGIQMIKKDSVTDWTHMIAALRAMNEALKENFNAEFDRSVERRNKIRVLEAQLVDLREKAKASLEEK